MTTRWPIALVAAVIATLVIGVAAIVLASRGGETSIFDLETGDCFVLPSAEVAAGDADATFDLELVDTIGCAEPHDAEVVLTGDLNPDGDRLYPSDDELFAEIEGACATLESLDRGRFGIVPVAPNEASWGPLRGGYLCLAVPFGTEPVTGSAGAG